MTDGIPGGIRSTYDEGADALGITLAHGRAARTQQLAQLVRVDWDKEGRLLFLEILAASQWYPLEQLRALASPAIDLDLEQAAKKSGLAISTLRDQIGKRRLPARKVGRNWVVTLADLYTYLANRHPAGRPAAKRKARRPKVPALAVAATKGAAKP